jgi:hypothetical protein
VADTWPAKFMLALCAQCDYFNRMNNAIEKATNNHGEAKKAVKRATTADLPMVDLGSVLEFVDKIESKGLQTLSTIEVAEGLGFATRTSTPFYRRMLSAKLFGLLDTTQGVNLTKLALDYFKPMDDESKKATLLTALKSVVAYQKILDRYEGKRVHVDILGNLMEREFSLKAEGAKLCANVFLASVQFAGYLQPNGTLSGATPQPGAASRSPESGGLQPADRVVGREPLASEDSESHFLTLDAKRKRRVVLQGPAVVTASELKRIQNWLAVQFHVVDSVEGGEPPTPQAAGIEQNNGPDL